MKVTILFDKDKLDNRLEAGWGIAYLIGNTLFDTAERFDYLSNNMKVLGIDIQKIANIIISHKHWDHLGGLWQLLEIKNDIKVYACTDFIEDFKEKINKYNFVEVKPFDEIENKFYSTGSLKTLYKGKELFEQALIIKTVKGISIVCGCAHPGIVKIIKKAKEHFPDEKIYSVFGGFHLMDADTRLIRHTVSEIKKIGVERIGPAHCTGYEAAEIFRQAYQGNFLEIQAGKEFEI